MTVETAEKSKEKIVRTSSDRPSRSKRIPFGAARTKLSIDQQIEGYHLHWINDTPGRVHEAEQGGYEFVTPSEIGMTSDETVVKRLVGKNDDGSGMYAFLMKIKMEWYLEDQQESQKKVDQIDASIRGGDIENVGNRYNAGIKYKS